MVHLSNLQKQKKLSQIVVFFTIFERIVFKPEKNPSQTVQFGIFEGTIFTSRPEKNLGQMVEGKKSDFDRLLK